MLRRAAAHSRPRAFIASLIVAGSVVAACSVDPGVFAGPSEPIDGEPAPTTAPAPPTAPPTTSPSPTTPSTPTTPTAPTAPPTTVPSLPPEPVLQLGGLTIADLAMVGAAKTARDYDDLVAATLLDLEDWLTDLYPQLHGEPWVPLAGGVYPAYPDRTDIPGCGEPSTSYDDVNLFVAFYCSQGDFMVYDDGDESLLGALAAEFGPSVLGVVLAHEYAHVIQQRNGVLTQGLPTIVTEQQADCFAGAWVGRAASGGSDIVGLTDADISGALITMVAVRDPVGLGQFEVGGHGSAFDRVGAFQVGFRDGPERCAELIDDPLPLMPNEFQSLIDARNEGDLPFGYDDGQIVPLIVDTLNDYWTFQVGELDSVSVEQFRPFGLVPLFDGSNIECPEPARSVAPGLAVCETADAVLLDDAISRALYDDPIVGSADFAVGYHIALAWSDIVQELLGSPLTGADRALANDCLAGAYTRDLDPLRPLRPGEETRIGTISPGDLDEAVVAAIEIGDDDASVRVLGTPFEKISAFRDGVLAGVDPCLERMFG